MILAKINAEPYKTTQYLAQCPFCGGDAQLMKTSDESGIVTKFVRCKTCGASADFSHFTDRAIQKWNRRK